MSLASQISQLDRTRATYKPGDRVEWYVGRMVNSLIEQAREEVADNRLLNGPPAVRARPE